MTNELLRLMNDVLNELRNTKYYAQDELRGIVEDKTITQREKVHRTIDKAGELVSIDAKIAMIDAVFTASPEQSLKNQVNDENNNANTQPDNIVEEQLNNQGQSHSE